MNNHSKATLGVVLIIIGILSISSRTNLFNFRVWDLWPYIILGIGLLFEYNYFKNNCVEPGLLVPAGILITIGINFVLCVTFGWHIMSYTWPLFIMAPGIGLLQYYFFGQGHSALLVPIGILLGLGTIFLSGNMLSNLRIGSTSSIILIGLGIFLLLTNRKDKKYN